MHVLASTKKNIGTLGSTSLYLIVLTLISPVGQHESLRREIQNPEALYSFLGRIFLRRYFSNEYTIGN
jgi:hypothetical protein